MKLTEATILVVDDEPDLLEIFEQWLKAAGCSKVLTAVNGEEALAIAMNTPTLDLLVTDIQMPIMDGVSLVRRLSELGSSLPSVIFVSGFGDVGAREMYGMGVEAFLAKPLRRIEFIAAMEQALIERSSLWLVPMIVPPKQSMRVEAAGLGGTDRENFVHLGRGGFSAHYPNALTLGKVSFQCSFVSQSHELQGEGYVRWRSRAEKTFGIEFAYLDPNCRNWLLDAITTAAPRSFIPGL